IFNFKRCIVHFAVDDDQVKMCTKLSGKSSWFLPFNKGNNDGAGNPVNPDGTKTDYLWKSILTKRELSNIIENFAQVVVERDEKTKKITKETQIFPRYHQLAVVKGLLADTLANGVGHKYLIQHSAGSGKSNSIAWLAHQSVVLQSESGEAIFDSIIVVTDRVNLDKQIRNTIRQFMQEKSTFGWAESASELSGMIEQGKKIIVTTVHKFPFILDGISSEYSSRKFAIIIDEAHSSQNGSMSAKMNMILSGNVADDEEDLEDKIIKIIKGRKMLSNANYYAFTATPKNKTLQMFGVPFDQPDGEIGHRPFHNYSMKQAIEEGFIMDVLKHYTPISSFYQLAKKIEDDPQFDKKRSEKKLRVFVESNEYTVRKKSEIIVSHFHSQVVSKGKIGGGARAMVVTASILRAIDYYYAITKLLEDRKSQYRAIIAFSGEKEYNGSMVTESSINGFPSNMIENNLKQEPYRFLIVANKFQTGFDEPLLHTMYVDKVLTDIKAVQTLSRLNRAHPLKRDTFVLDFANDTETIQRSFQDYYKTTILSSETDPNKLNDLLNNMEQYQVYSSEDIDVVVGKLFSGASRSELDPILDSCKEIYKELGEDGQVDFKSSAKAFVRTYTFLAAILPFGSTEWEKLSQFLTLLIPKLPSPESEDLSKGILDNIDFDSYKNTIQSEVSISLDDEDAEIDPVPISAGGGISDPELDFLSMILNSFNTRFGDIPWSDEDKVRRVLAELPAEVAKSEVYQNAIKNSDEATARIESDAALQRVILEYMTSNMELFKNFNDNKSFKEWLQEYVFDATYNKASMQSNMMR
ncbi:MAG: DEAD/DEAH box helicase family protein, partial [Rikenellaceae bacterium]